MAVPKEVLGPLNEKLGGRIRQFILEARLRNRIGFALLLFEYKGGNMSLHHSAKDAQALVPLLKELIDRIEGRNPGKQIITIH